VTRVGVVDLGTNSTRLLVADVEEGAVREVERRLTITRLGEGVDERRILLPTALARARNALADYRRVLEASGAERTLAVATSAVRDAENGEAFLGEVEWSYGFETRLLTGDEEAYHEVEGEPRLARASGTQRFTGDIGGDGSVVWLMCYRPDRTARFVGLQRIEGSIGELRGSFLIEASGDHDGSSSGGSWTVIAGSGIGDFVGLTGEGGFEAPGGPTATYRLDYRLA